VFYVSNECVSNSLRRVLAFKQTIYLHWIIPIIVHQSPTWIRNKHYLTILSNLLKIIKHTILDYSLRDLRKIIVNEEKLIGIYENSAREQST